MSPAEKHDPNAPNEPLSMTVLMDVLDTIRDNFGKSKLQDSTYDLWWKNLQSFRNQSVRNALNRVVVEDELSKFPRVGEFGKLCRQEEAKLLERELDFRRCPQCDNRGMYHKRDEKGRDWMVLCRLCPMGEMKRRYLEAEEGDGQRWRGDARDEKERY